MDTNTKTLIGIDIETTGSDPKSEIIQIGVYIDDEHLYVSDIGHRGYFYYETKAFEINGFTFPRIFDGQPAFMVDAKLCVLIETWQRHTNLPLKSLLPVGWNVGSFDMQFIRRTLPKFFAKFGYHTLDLNAMLFTITDLDQLLTNELKQTLKKTCLPPGTIREHDALWDAQQAVLIADHVLKTAPHISKHVNKNKYLDTYKTSWYNLNPQAETLSPVNTESI